MWPTESPVAADNYSILSATGLRKFINQDENNNFLQACVHKDYCKTERIEFIF
jgi:hypothetical protein